MSRWTATLFVIVTLLLLLRNTAFDSPLMAGDEYAYYAASQTFPHSETRFAADPYLPRIYSPVFASYGRLLFSLAPQPEYLLKTLNVLAFALVALFYTWLLHRVGGTRSSWLAALMVLTPFSAYTAYFMPEATYSLCFAALAAAVVVLLPARLLAGAATAGVVVGTMLLVKPHALALVTAVPLTIAAWATAPSGTRPRRTMLAAAALVFLLACYGTLVLENAGLTGTLRLHPFAFVGGVYQPYLAAGSSVAEWIERQRQLIAILAGHLIVLGALVAPAIGLGAGRLWAACLGAVPSSLSRRRLHVLICFALAVATATLGMTTVFTMVAAQTSAVEHLRLHGRYYSFFLPLFFVLYFALINGSDGSDDGWTPVRRERWLRAAAAAGVVVSALLFYLHVKRVIYPYDFPEAFVFSAWEGRPRTGLVEALTLIVRYGAVVSAMGVYAFIAIRGTRAWRSYPILLIGLFVASNAGVTGWQHANSRDRLALRADARAARQLIGAEARDRGVVVGTEWNNALAYFLFNFQSSPHVLVRDPALPLTRADLPPDIGWAVLIGPYRPDFGVVGWRTGTMTFVTLNK